MSSLLRAGLDGLVARRLQSQVEGVGRGVYLFWLAFFSVSAGVAVFALIYNLYLLELGFREDFIGAFNALTTVGTAAFAIPAGSAADRLGYRRAFLLGALGMGIAGLGLSLLTQPMALLALSFLYGAMQNLFFVVLIPFLADQSPLHRRKGLFAINYTIYTLAVMFGSLLGGQLPALLRRLLSVAPNVLAFRGTLLAAVALMAIASLPVLFITAHVRERQENGEEQSRNLPSLNGQSPQRTVIVFAAIAGVVNLAHGVTGPFFNVYFASELGATDSLIGFIFVAASALSVAATLGGPFVASRVGTVRAIAFGRLLAAPLLLALVAWPGMALGVAAYLLRSFSIYLAWPLDSSFVTEVLDGRARARAVGLRTAVGNVTWSVASLVAGYLIVSVGYAPMFATTAALSVVATGMYLLYFRSPVAAEEQVEP